MNGDSGPVTGCISNMTADLLRDVSGAWRSVTITGHTLATTRDAMLRAGLRDHVCPHEQEHINLRPPPDIKTMLH